LSARSNIYRIAVDALFVALYVILGTYLSFKIPGAIQISFSTLPILLCAFLLHPADAVAVAVIGNLLEQIIDPSPYGFATLLIWLIPGAVQALVASFGAQLVHRAASKKRALILMIAVIVCADLVLTLLNTGALYLDGYLLDYPVKALHLLLQEGVKNFHFTIIGDGEQKQVIEDYIKAQSMQEYISILPFIPAEEVRQYMDKADIYVFGSNFYEGWGAVVNEAMDSACPRSFKRTEYAACGCSCHCQQGGKVRICDGERVRNDSKEL
jgi:ECF transporter S component (folate family)